MRNIAELTLTVTHYSMIHYVVFLEKVYGFEQKLWLNQSLNVRR